MKRYLSAVVMVKRSGLFFFAFAVPIPTIIFVWLESDGIYRNANNLSGLGLMQEFILGYGLAMSTRELIDSL